jgi:Ca2+-binding RTX toxin-like protein
VSEFSFVIGGDAAPLIRITITDNGNGSFTFKVEQVGSGVDGAWAAGDLKGEIRGLFFDINGNVSLGAGNLTVNEVDGRTGGTLATAVTTGGAGENDVTGFSVKGFNDVNMNGAGLPADGGYDVGIAFGSAGIGAKGDDIQGITFTLTGLGAFTLEDFMNVDFGVRLTSVGTVDENGDFTGGRDGGAKITGVSPEAGANAAPVADNGADEVDEDGVLAGTLPAATDPDGDPVSYAKASDPAHGTVTVNADGTFQYTPDANFSGEDSFTFTVSDGKGGANTYTYTVSVNPVADAPALTVTNAFGYEHDEIALSIEAALTDTDGSETLSITISGLPEGAFLSAGVDNGDGSWTLAPADLADLTLTVVLAPGASEPAEFTLTVTAVSTEGGNGDSASSVGSILVSVTPLEQPEALVGNAIDGYLVGATVFADANLNGVLDAGEAWTTTGSNGQFALAGGSGPLVLYGGTDMSTGLPFNGVLKAPEGSTVVTPLTTLLAALVDGGATLEDAQSLVKDAFGLADVNLTAYDPVQAALEGDAGALAVYAAGVQIQNIAVLAAAATGMTIEEAAAATITALTAAIAAAEPVDLAAPSEQLLQAVTGEADVTTLQAVVAAVNTQVSDATGAGSNLDALTQMTQAAVVAQSEEAAAAASGTNTQDFVDNVASTVASAEVGVIGGSVTGTAGSDTLTGTAGNDALDGLAGNDRLSGLAGNDFLFGGAGNDTLVGGAGNDRLDGGENPAGVLGDIDWVDYSAEGGPNGVVVNLAAGTATDSFGNTDVLVNIEAVRGTAAADVLTGGDAGNIGTNRSEQFEGMGGNDTITGGIDNNLVSYGSSPAGVVVDLAAGTASDGWGGTDTLVNINRVRGSMHDDVLIGSDTGATGNERFEALAGNDTIHGGGGIDYVMYQVSPGAVTVTFTGGGNGTASDGWGTTDTFTGIEGVRGSSFGDVLTGSNRTDTVERFEGMAGNDTINGGGGLDRVEYNQSPTGVIVDLAAGTASDGFGGTDTLIGIEQATGSLFDDVFIGSNGNNRFDGGAGSDTVSYQAAASGVTVNLGIVNAAQNTGGGGSDTLISIENVVGSAFNDTLIGNAGANYLMGGLGGDTLVGGAGNDKLEGGESPAGMLEDIDVVDYGLEAGPGGVIANLATGVATDSFGGTDTLIDIERLNGTAFDDVLIAGNPTSPGTGRSELLEGRAGNDYLAGGDPAAGYSTFAVYTGAPAGIVVNLTSGDILLSGGGTLAAGTALDGYGTVDTLVNINRIRGSAHADLIFGSNAPGAVERFEGMAGDDTIYGGGGIDYVMYQNSPNAVTVTFGNLLGDGTASDGWGTTDYFYSIEGVRGSAHADVLTGSDRTDPGVVERFEGMAGNDTINGGLGPDRAEYGQSPAGVTVNLALGTASDGFGGTDTLISIEQASGSRFDDTLIGSSGNNRLDGGLGNDTLDGGGGADLLIGGLGNDILTGGAGGDTFAWGIADQGSAANPAIDTITDFDLAANGDRLDLRDLLVGASPTAASVDDYLDFSFGDGNTTIDVRPTGAGGDVTQKIVLQGVDLTAIGTGSDADIISSLLSTNKLIVV